MSTFFCKEVLAPLEPGLSLPNDLGRCEDLGRRTCEKNWRGGFTMPSTGYENLDVETWHGHVSLRMPRQTVPKSRGNFPIHSRPSRGSARRDPARPRLPHPTRGCPEAARSVRARLERSGVVPLDAQHIVGFSRWVRPRLQPRPSWTLKTSFTLWRGRRSELTTRLSSLET